MTSKRLIKRRIKSVRNISQLTRAMEMVAASKMRKAQKLALQGKAYAQKILEVTGDLSLKTKPGIHPLLASRPVLKQAKKLVILVTTNKGLCGGLNTNLLRFLQSWVKGEPDNFFEFITLGKKSYNFLYKEKIPWVADFSLKLPWVANVPAIIDLATKGFLADRYDEVWLCYNDFINALRQEPRRKKILPITQEQQEEGQREVVEFKIEPSADKVLEALLPHYLEVQLREAILEAEASEHSARMVAMKNATDNAVSLQGELTLLYNEVRQQEITSEIADIVTAKIGLR